MPSPPERPAQLILASASPRRAALLNQLGLVFAVRAFDIDETRRQGEPVEDTVRRLAWTKADTAARDASIPALGADTVVSIDGVVLGKPADRSEGLEMLGMLSGRSHDVLTAVAIVLGARSELALSRSRVAFRTISHAEARAYWDSGEPRDKAGGYGIQGIGGIFAERIEGSYSGIVGLPLAETEALLQAFGVDTWQYRCA